MKNLLKQLNARNVVWQSLPSSTYRIFLGAVFSLFSTIGYIAVLVNPEWLTVRNIIGGAIYSGMIGSLYAHAFIKNYKLIPFVLIIHIFLPRYLYIGGGWRISGDPGLMNHYYLVAAGILLSIISGYVLFILFINRYGKSKIRLETEIELATKLHNIIVPRINYSDEKFDVFANSIPAEEVGGDLADFYSENGRRIAVIADVSGHGVSSGFLMGMFKSGYLASLKLNASIGNALMCVNNVIISNKPRSSFITAAMAEFYDDGKVYYSVAGHHPLFHFSSRSGEFSELQVRQIPLGVKKDYTFVTEAAAYERGDIFLFLTDGLIELKNTVSKPVSEKMILEIASRNASLPAKEIAEKILEAVNLQGLRRDDQTLMVVRCK